MFNVSDHKAKYMVRIRTDAVFHQLWMPRSEMIQNINLNIVVVPNDIVVYHCNTRDSDDLIWLTGRNVANSMF